MKKPVRKQRRKATPEPPPDPQPKKNGRPPGIKIRLDYDEVMKLAQLQCTMGEIAAFFDVSQDTLFNRKKDDPRFVRALEKGYETGKRSLRRLQWKHAQTNPGMAIFLGKNYLGQRDRFEGELNAGGEVSLRVVYEDPRHHGAPAGPA